LYDVSKTDSRASALDASILNKTSALGAQQAGNLEKATPDKFVRKLLAKYGFTGTSNLKWAQFANDVHDAGIHQHVPALTFLLGKYEAPKKKEREARKRKEHAPAEPMQTAESVSVSQLQEVQEDKAQVARMKVLATAIVEAVQAEEAAGRERRVNLFHMLLHPTSFSQTVENFFDLAFLMKDGFVRLVTTADAAYIVDATPPEAEEYAQGLVKVQNILKLDFSTYRRLTDRWCTPGMPPLLKRRESRDAEAEGNSGADGGGAPGKKKARSS